VEVQGFEQLGSVPVHLLAVNQAEPIGRLPVDENVLGDGQIGGHRQFLVHNTDAQALRMVGVERLDGLAVEQDCPAVALVDASDDQHQGAFAGTVLSDHSVDFARTKGHAHVFQRLSAREGFVDVFDL